MKLDHVKPNGEPVMKPDLCVCGPKTRAENHCSCEPDQAPSVLDMGGEVRIIDPDTGAEKGSKEARFDLLPMDALATLARVYGMGATKYADHNWLGGYRWSLSLAALLRHVALFQAGEDNDPESGLPHLGHVAWHCFALMAFANRGLGTDDRYVITRGGA